MLDRFRNYRNRRRFGRELHRHFDRIYCINLDSRPDRWRYVRDHFRRFGLAGKVERFPAVDVRNHPEFCAYETSMQGNSLLAMCGCLLSHVEIVQASKAAGLDNVLVFEDDVKILEDNILGLRHSLKALESQPWDVFYLGATYVRRLEPVGPHLVRCPEGALATHAIAYNASVFDRVLDCLPNDPLTFLQYSKLPLPGKNRPAGYLDEPVNNVDIWLISDLFEHSHFYGSNPIMVVQGLSDSDITSRENAGMEQRQVELFAENLKLDGDYENRG